MSKKITETRLVTTLDGADLVTGVDVSDPNLETKNIQITKDNLLKDQALQSDVDGVISGLATHEAITGPDAHTGMLVTADMETHKSSSNQHLISGVINLQTVLNTKVASTDLGEAAYLNVTQDSLGVARGDRPASAVAAHVAADPADAHANLPSNAEKAALAGPGVNSPPGAGNTYLTEQDQLTEHSQIGGKDTDGHPGSVIETSQDPLTDTDKVLVVSSNGHIAVSSKTADQIGGGSTTLHADLVDTATDGHPGSVITVDDGTKVGKSVVVAADGTLLASDLEPGGVGGIGEAPVDGKYYSRKDVQWLESPTSPIGGMSLNYTYSELTSGTPIAGAIQTNSPADLTLATLIYVNKTSNTGNDVSIAWDSYQAGDYIGLWEKTSDHGAIVYQLNSPPAINGDVYTLNVSVIPGSDTNTISNGEAVVVYQIPSSLERMPPLGLTGQALVKASDANYDTEWVPIPDAGIADAPDANNHVRQQGLWVASDGLYAPAAHATNTLDGTTGHVSAQDRLDWDAAKDHADIVPGNPHGITLASLGGVPNTLEINTDANELTGGGALNQNRSLGLATVNSDVGSFVSAEITVDAFGRVTAAASGSGTPPQRFNHNATVSGNVPILLDGRSINVNVSDGVTADLVFTTAGNDANQENTCSFDLVFAGTGTVTIPGTVEQMNVFGAISSSAASVVTCVARSRQDGTIQLYRSEEATE